MWTEEFEDTFLTPGKGLPAVVEPVKPYRNRGLRSVDCQQSCSDVAKVRAVTFLSSRMSLKETCDRFVKFRSGNIEIIRFNKTAPVNHLPNEGAKSEISLDAVEVGLRDTNCFKDSRPEKVRVGTGVDTCRSIEEGKEVRMEETRERVGGLVGQQLSNDVQNRAVVILREGHEFLGVAHHPNFIGSRMKS